MESFSDVKVGDYIKYDFGTFYFRQTCVAVVTNVMPKTFCVKDGTIRFRKDDGKMIGSLKYASHATQSDIKQFMRDRRADIMRTKIRSYIHSSLEDMPYDKLEKLYKYLFEDEGKQKTD